MNASLKCLIAGLVNVPFAIEGHAVSVFAMLFCCGLEIFVAGCEITGGFINKEKSDGDR